MGEDVISFLSSIENKNKQKDAKLIVEILAKASGYQPYMQGSMVGFGIYQYKYESGRKGEFFVTGFAPRKQNLTIYIMPGFSQYTELLSQLGKHKLGKSCLYINKLDDINLDVLETIVKQSVEEMQSKYTCRAH